MNNGRDHGFSRNRHGTKVSGGRPHRKYFDKKNGASRTQYDEYVILLDFVLHLFCSHIFNSAVKILIAPTMTGKRPKALTYTGTLKVWG